METEGFKDINRSHEDFDGRVKNLEGILDKVRTIFGELKEERELKEIQAKEASNQELKQDMGALQAHWDYAVLQEYCDSVDAITERVEKDYLPFYKLKLLYTKIDADLEVITAETIHEIIADTKELVDVINSIKHESHKIKKNIVESAYKTLYNAMLYERLFQVNDIFNYVISLGHKDNKENLGRLIAQDIKKLDANEIIGKELEAIDEEGLGYDYLSEDIITELSRIILGSPNSDYQERKAQAISEIEAKADYILSEKNRVISAREANEKELKKIQKAKHKIALKIAAALMIPVVTTSLGYSIGAGISSTITEYGALTRTVNAETGKLIEEPTLTYDEIPTTYVASITVYEPWRRNPAGYGYIRNASVYEYITPENVSDDYHVSLKDIEGNVLKKYSFVDPKDVLDSNDSLEDYEILITETYPDKDSNRKSTKFIVPGIIIGLLLGLGIDVALFILKVFSVYELQSDFYELSSKAKKGKIKRDELSVDLIILKKKAELLTNDYNDVVKKYGSFKDKIVMPTITDDEIMLRIRKK